MARHEWTARCSCGETVTLDFSDDIYRERFGYALLGGYRAWEHWPHLVDVGVLNAEHGGPETYGHVSLYVDSEAASKRAVTDFPYDANGWSPFDYRGESSD